MEKIGGDWTKEVQIWDEERKKALEYFQKAMKRWDLSAPKVEPLVLDFGLGNFFRWGLIEFWIANEEKEGYCGKFLFVFPWQTCPYHHHNFKHETFYVVKGSIIMRLGKRRIVMWEGDVFSMKQGTGHSFTGRGHPGALLLEVSKPCKPGDSIFNNKRIGKNGSI